MRRLTILAAAVLAMAGGVTVAAPATRPAAKATTKPVVKAADTEGDVLGIKLVGKEYDPKSGQVTVEFALGNKSNKVITGVQGYFTLTGDVIPRRNNISLAYLPFTVTEPIGRGEVQIVRAVVARLPSETDAEIVKSRQRVDAVDSADYSRVKIRFEGGATRELD